MHPHDLHPAAPARLPDDRRLSGAHPKLTAAAALTVAPGASNDRPADAPLSARFWVEEPGRAPRQVFVPAGVPVRVGRSYVAELPIIDREVSRLHALLRFDGGTVTLSDHQSSNGTFLGGLRVDDAVTVPPGAAIQIGATLLVRCADSPRRSSAGATGAGSDDASPVAADPAMADVVAQARRLAAMNVPLWIQGEPGSGKSVLARVIHQESRRAGRPSMRVACAALPRREVARTLLGYRYQSANGAARTLGLIERADGGTLLLERIEALPAAGLEVLLDVLRRRAITPVGDTHAMSVDVRLVTTCDDPAPRTTVDGLRARLYPQLRGAVLVVPPLRDRPRDIVPLAERFMALAGDPRPLGAGVAAALRAYRWPGNVRELRDAVAFSRAVAEGGEITLDDLPRSVRAPGDELDPEEVQLRASQRDTCERSAIVLALAATGDLARAARVLEVSRTALRHAMERLAIDPRALGAGG